jgi:hypothetical protein
MSPGADGSFRAPEVGNQRQYVQPLQLQGLPNDLCRVGHLWQPLRGNKGTNLNFAQTGCGEGGYPLMFRLRRHDAVNALQAIPGAHLTDENVDFRTAGHGASRLSFLLCRTIVRLIESVGGVTARRQGLQVRKRACT